MEIMSLKYNRNRAHLTVFYGKIKHQNHIKTNRTTRFISHLLRFVFLIKVIILISYFIYVIVFLYDNYYVLSYTNKLNLYYTYVCISITI